MTYGEVMQVVRKIFQRVELKGSATALEGSVVNIDRKYNQASPKVEE